MRATDAAALFAYRGDPEVARYQGWQPATEAECAAFIAEQAARPFAMPDGWNQLAIRSRASGELIGDFGMHFPPSADDAVEFGISLKPTAQRHGYAREVMAAVINRVFHDWGYRRLIASVDPRNTASVALCRALEVCRTLAVEAKIRLCEDRFDQLRCCEALRRFAGP